MNCKKLKKKNKKLENKLNELSSDREQLRFLFKKLKKEFTKLENIYSDDN